MDDSVAHECPKAKVRAPASLCERWMFRSEEVLVAKVDFEFLCLVSCDRCDFDRCCNAREVEGSDAATRRAVHPTARLLCRAAKCPGAACHPVDGWVLGGGLQLLPCGACSLVQGVRACGRML